MSRKKLTYREAIERNAYLAFQLDMARRALANCESVLNDMFGWSYPLSKRLANAKKNADAIYSRTEDEMYHILKQYSQFDGGLQVGDKRFLNLEDATKECMHSALPGMGISDAGDVFYCNETRKALVGHVVNHSEEWDEFRAYALKRAGMSEPETKTDERH